MEDSAHFVYFLYSIIFRLSLISLNKVFILVVLLYGYSCIQSYVPDNIRGGLLHDRREFI